jgi:hypothetical protein
MTIESRGDEGPVYPGVHVSIRTFADLDEKQVTTFILMLEAEAPTLCGPYHYWRVFTGTDKDPMLAYEQATHRMAVKVQRDPSCPVHVRDRTLYLMGFA